jgi:L-amino acid N-acyltransferase
MKLIDCTFERHAAAILDIFNDAILNTTALYEYKPRTMETMKTWFATKETNRFPVIGAVSEAGELMGFASWGTFRAFPANKYTVEQRRQSCVDECSRCESTRGATAYLDRWH